LPVQPGGLQAGIRQCPHIGCYTTVREDGTHAFTCNHRVAGSAATFAVTTHTRVRNLVHAAIARARARRYGAPIQVLSEPQLISVNGFTPKYAAGAAPPGVPIKDRGDILVTDPNAGTTHVIDVRIVSPISTAVPQSSTTMGAAAKAGKNAKEQEYVAWDYPSGALVPFIVENGGFLLPASVAFVKNLILEHHVDTMDEFGRSWSLFLTQLSVVLQKANAQRMLVHSRDYAGHRPRVP